VDELLAWMMEHPSAQLPSFDELAAVLVGRPAWQQRAACRGVGPGRFYVAGGEHTAATVHAWCTRCPVRSECLDAALEAHDDLGVWGGVAGGERRLLRRRLAREERRPVSTGV
jgi:WhiB family redox-sensing transcriptional regulator